MGSSMSLSEGQDRAAVVAGAERLAEASAELSPEQLAALVGATARLYAGAAAREGREIPLAGAAMTPTDVVVLCCALLRAQDLSPFDLTLWFGRTGA